MQTIANQPAKYDTVSYLKLVFTAFAAVLLAGCASLTTPQGRRMTAPELNAYFPAAEHPPVTFNNGSMARFLVKREMGDRFPEYHSATSRSFDSRYDFGSAPVRYRVGRFEQLVFLFEPLGESMLVTARCYLINGEQVAECDCKDNWGDWLQALADSDHKRRMELQQEHNEAWQETLKERAKQP